MTPEDLTLDPEFFAIGRTHALFRLARMRYANLSGAGSAFAPGRWNHLGQEAIYTSTQIGVPLLERLAHTSKNLIPANLGMMKLWLSLEGSWHIRESPGWRTLSKNQSLFFIATSLRTAKEFFQPGSFAINLPIGFAVPSVIVPVWNVVLYPQAIGFWEHVFLESIEPFEFDPRLFPENTPTETP